jgi:hypothetical protein
VNNDGFPDLVVTEYRGVRLFLNDGRGAFTDVSAAAGVSNPVWGTSAAFVDYDRDGWLDLVVANYVDYDRAAECHGPGGARDYCQPQQFSGTAAKLFRNRGKPGDGGGPGVRFEDVTISSGLAGRPGPGLGVVCADFTGDGWPDLFIANDGKPNHLWVNQKNGTFAEEAVPRGVALNAMGAAEANMGIGWGDVDGDGLQDVFVTHVSYETNTLWRQGPRGLFQDRTAAAGLHRPARRATGFGTVLADFDHDGAPDVAVVNGGVARTRAFDPDPGAFWGQYAQPNQLFVNDGAGRFRDASSANSGPRGLCGDENVGRGLAAGDVANDGTLWLVATSVAGPVRVYRNVAPGRGRWLVIRAYDPALKRDALGAEVTVRAGPRSWVRTVQGSGSYLCASDTRAHFGLGTVDHIDSISVLWPDGVAETFPPERVDHHLELRKGTGKPAARD